MNGPAIAVVVVAAVLLLAHRERNGRRRALSGPWWPWLIGVIERDLDLGRGEVLTATVRACLGGPPALRSAAEDAVRTGGPTDPMAVVGALRDRVGTADGDRLFGTVVAVHERGASAGPALAWARADAAVAAMHTDRCAAVAAGGRAARWLLLAPVVPGVTGQLPGLVGWGAVAIAVTLWWGAGRWLRGRPDVRVFVAETNGPRG